MTAGLFTLLSTQLFVYILLIIFLFTFFAAVTSSYAFMLPVATAPNAIVFGASSMTTAHMMKAGLGMNLVTVLTTLLAINSYAVPLFGLDSFPEWGIPQLPV